MGGVRADGARDFAPGGRGEAEEVQRGDAASRKEGVVLLLGVFTSFSSSLFPVVAIRMPRVCGVAVFTRSLDGRTRSTCFGDAPRTSVVGTFWFQKTAMVAEDYTTARFFTRMGRKNIARREARGAV